MKLGQVISALRQERELTQEQLALEAGTNAGYVSRIEQGKGVPSLQLLERIATALGTTLAGVFAATEDNQGPAGPPTELKDASESDYTTEAIQLRRTFRDLTPENQRLTVEFVKVLERMQRDATVGE